MGWRVALTPEAEADFRDIVSFIAAASPSAAIRMGEALIDLIFSLDHLPHRGAAMRNRPELRKLSWHNLLIIYRLDEATSRIEIVRIWDGRQDPAKLKLD